MACPACGITYRSSGLLVIVRLFEPSRALVVVKRTRDALARCLRRFICNPLHRNSCSKPVHEGRHRRVDLEELGTGAWISSFVAARGHQTAPPHGTFFRTTRSHHLLHTKPGSPPWIPCRTVFSGRPPVPDDRLFRTTAYGSSFAASTSCRKPVRTRLTSAGRSSISQCEASSTG